MNTKTDSSNHYLWLFFILTFAFSWLMCLPNVLITHNIITTNPSITNINNIMKWVAGIGPSLAAIFLVIKFEGKVALIVLLKRVLKLKLGYWYFPVFLVLPVVLVLAHLLNIIFFNASFLKTGLLLEPWWIPVVLSIFFVLQFGEELGWRGYALDRLQKKMNALFSSIFLGSIWAIWHLPMFLSSGFGHRDYHLPFGQFFITLVLMSIIITWLQNNTNGSLIPAFIIHAQINLSGEVLPLIEKNLEIQGEYTAWIISNVLLFLLIVVILIFWGHKKLVRQKNAI